ncbi:MAG: hypothetical protein IPM64_16330 [Phycisphaerales bacterium]|nr:hypothetical protein [Phycisphaerales bacterium]
MHRRGRLLHSALLLALLTPAGCGWLGAAIYLLRPPVTTKAEFRFQGRVAIIIETARSHEENPLFSQALYDAFCENLVTAKAPIDAIPLEKFHRLRQDNPDFASWGIQRIGHALGADQVLYIRLARLQFQEFPGAPLIEPRVAASLIVVGTSAPADKPRLWPEAIEGRELTLSRQTRDAADPRALDEEATRMGREFAHIIARFFHDYDAEEPLQKER